LPFWPIIIHHINPSSEHSRARIAFAEIHTPELPRFASAPRTRDADRFGADSIAICTSKLRPGPGEIGRLTVTFDQLPGQYGVGICAQFAVGPFICPGDTQGQRRVGSPSEKPTYQQDGSCDSEGRWHQNFQLHNCRLLHRNGTAALRKAEFHEAHFKASSRTLTVHSRVAFLIGSSAGGLVDL